MFAAVVGVTFGVIAGLRRNRPTDHALRVASLAGISMPTFWIALIVLYVGFYRLGWFPGGQRLDPGTSPPPSVTGMYTIDALLDGNLGLFGTAFHHLLLPALVLAAFNVSLLMRFTRSAVLEVVGNDYVRAARAKGMPERVVVRRYILRAALPAVVTVLGLVFANVLTGAVLVEKIFSWPGVGQYAYQAAVNVDVPAIAGVSLFVAAVYVTVNFIVDILYGIIDPRIRVIVTAGVLRGRSLTSGPPHPPGPASAARRGRPRDRGRLGRAGGVRAADRTGRSPRADVHAVGGAVVAAPVRNRRARPRRPEPRALRRAG